MIDSKTAFQKIGTMDSINFVANNSPLIRSILRNECFAFFEFSIGDSSERISLIFRENCYIWKTVTI